MKKLIDAALIGNISGLGVHWIYDRPYLEKLSEQQNLIFTVQNQEIYEKAKKSYYVYANKPLGSVSTQGMFLYWLSQALETNPNLTQTDYKNLLFNKIKPGGSYSGYIESYAKKMIIEELSKDLSLELPVLPKTDDHLVGFIPYIAYKAHQLDLTHALKLTQLFSNLNEYQDFFNVFDILLSPSGLNLIESLKKSIHQAPPHYKLALEQALTSINLDLFINNYSGIACQIDQSLPLIFYVLSHSSSFEEMLKLNAKLGGATADRGLILGMIGSIYYPIPGTFKKFLNYSILEKQSNP